MMKSLAFWSIFKLMIHIGIFLLVCEGDIELVGIFWHVGFIENNISHILGRIVCYAHALTLLIKIYKS